MDPFANLLFLSPFYWFEINILVNISILNILIHDQHIDAKHIGSKNQYNHHFLLIFLSNQYEKSHIDYYQYLRDRDAGFFPKSQCLIISSEKMLMYFLRNNEGVSFFSEGVIRHAGFSLNDKWQMSACPLRQALFYFWSRFSEASRLRASSFLQEK